MMSDAQDHTLYPTAAAREIEHSLEQLFPTTDWRVQVVPRGDYAHLRPEVESDRDYVAVVTVLSSDDATGTGFWKVCFDCGKAQTVVEVVWPKMNHLIRSQQRSVEVGRADLAHDFEHER